MRIACPQREIAMLTLAVLLVGLSATAYIRLVLATPFHPIPASGHSTYKAKDGNGARAGAVTSESTICSRVGVDLLKAGGSAADALVGTVFCVGVVAMYHSGIGGGGFMLVRAPNGSYETIDFREAAPAAAFEQMFEGDKEASLVGGLASGVPGELRGTEYLHKHHGRLKWSELLEPAIKLARGGFPVTGDLVRMMDNGDNGFLVEDPAWALDFAPNGTRVGLGDIMYRKRYADTLEQISHQGPNAFYTGPIANATISAISLANGTMSMEDLADYSVEIRKPVQIEYRDYKLTSCGAPASGAVALSAMKTVEGYADFGRSSAINLSTHRLDEAFRFAYGQRVNLGDPSFVPELDEYQQQMINKTTAARNRAMISDIRTLNVSSYDPTGLNVPRTAGTSGIVVIDAEGLAITITTSVNDFFGSQVMVPETGVILNDEMNDFSVPGSVDIYGYAPSPANFIRPGKRPLSSITPVIVEFLANSTTYFAVNAAGGSHIITSVTESLWHVLDMHMTARQALAEPRFHDQLIPNQVEFDWTFDNSTVAFMESRGHNVTWGHPGISNVYAIRRLPNGTFEPATEPHLVAGGAFAI